MQIETLPVASLTPYANNSRTHSETQVAQIVASIHEFGFTNPVLIDEHGGIIAGHGRVMAATKLGLREVPCIRLSHLNEAQRRAYVIADNKLALNAGWDEATLAAELRALAAMDFDLALTGFDDKELDDLLDDLDAIGEPGLTDPDAAPPPPDEPVSRAGDVWVMGRHRLMCGDSTNLEHVQALMAGEQADLVWTDPPYNVAVEGKAGKILNDSMQPGEFRDFLRGVYASLYAVMRPGAVIYVAHSEAERAAFADCLVQAGLKLSQVLIWVKQSATLSRQDFNWQHEPILYGWKEGVGHYFCEDFTLTTVMDDDLDLQQLKKEQLIGMVMELRGRTASSVVRHDRPTKSELHPTMKPVALVERMVSWSSRPGEIVLDLFGGSGSTLIAAQKSNRRARLMELDPKYCDVIVRRWQEYTGGGGYPGRRYPHLRPDRGRAGVMH
ncbi:site-specific DNA-methyltransferase [Castellaniella sp. S9]|uniref:site-specific DNA-methyltransferase n=1 Tax=Castellaniella sp. S9 TaxID=2993652 RepID=UPI0022B5D163|nr:site-specific DNA-methyltransferase [Castellaniella sp. S9]